MRSTFVALTLATLGWFQMALFGQDGRGMIAGHQPVRPAASVGDQRHLRTAVRERAGFRVPRTEMAELCDGWMAVEYHHPNFDAPNTTVTGSAFGTVTSQGGLSRQVQGALKLTF